MSCPICYGLTVCHTPYGSLLKWMWVNPYEFEGIVCIAYDCEIQCDSNMGVCQQRMWYMW